MAYPLPSEVAGAASALREHMTSIKSSRTDLLDTCGTGGSGTGAFNISTAAAIVAAATGVPVAKHGNRGITSRSGSADVLLELGVNIDADVQTVERCLDDVGIGFCFAPLLHRSMKHVAAVRKKLGVPTIFNMLGPLCNPAGARFQLLGVGRPELRPLLSAALAKLGTERAVVVCGDDGLDEVTLDGATQVTEINKTEQSDHTWQPSDFGFQRADKESLIVEGPQQSAALIREIFGGANGPPRNIVVMNAAAALWTVGKYASLDACAAAAAEAIDTGAARDLLARLAEVSNS